MACRLHGDPHTCNQRSFSIAARDCVACSKVFPQLNQIECSGLLTKGRVWRDWAECGTLHASGIHTVLRGRLQWAMKLWPTNKSKLIIGRDTSLYYKSALQHYSMSFWIDVVLLQKPGLLVVLQAWSGHCRSPYGVNSLRQVLCFNNTLQSIHCDVNWSFMYPHGGNPIFWTILNPEEICEGGAQN